VAALAHLPPLLIAITPDGITSHQLSGDFARRRAIL